MVKDYKRLTHFEASEKTANSIYNSEETYQTYRNEKKINLENDSSIPDLELETTLLPGNDKNKTLIRISIYKSVQWNLEVVVLTQLSIG